MPPIGAGRSDGTDVRGIPQAEPKTSAALSRAVETGRLRLPASLDLRVGAALALLALALRLGVALAVPTLFTADSPSYLRIASELAASGSITDNRLDLLRMPGYPVALAAILKIPLAGDTALALGQALLGALAVAFAFAVARSLGASRGRAGAVAIFVLLAPPYLVLDRAVMSEGLALTLLLAFSASALSLYRRPSSILLAVATGLAGGALALTRLNALPFLILLPVPVALRWAQEAREGGRRRSAAALAALIATIALVILVLPTLERNRERFGRWTLFASPAKVRLVYAAQKGLVDPEGALARFYRSGPEQGHFDPVMELFWALARLPSGGETEARALLAAARAEEPEAFRAARMVTFVHYLGADRSPGEPGSWLDAEVREPWRAEPRSRRFLSTSGRSEHRGLVDLLRRGCRFYAAFRPVLLIALLLGVGLAASALRRSDGRPHAGLVALVAAHFATAALHAWALADYSRFFVIFDWLPVAVLFASLPGPNLTRALARRQPAPIG